MIYTPFEDGEKPAWQILNERFAELDRLISGLSGPVGTISPFARPTAPTGWLLCDGSAVSRTTYADLFSVIGTTYGNGDGLTTFNLPDLRGRTPIGSGQGTLLTNRVLGVSLGEESHQLTVDEIPAHTHDSAGAHFFANLPAGAVNQYSAISPSGSTGGDQAHNNMQPSLVVNWSIKT